MGSLNRLSGFRGLYRAKDRFRVMISGFKELRHIIIEFSADVRRQSLEGFARSDNEIKAFMVRLGSISKIDIH